jgi:hypothetical protein
VLNGSSPVVYGGIPRDTIAIGNEVTPTLFFAKPRVCSVAVASAMFSHGVTGMRRITALPPRPPRMGQRLECRRQNSGDHGSTPISRF